MNYKLKISVLLLCFIINACIKNSDNNSLNGIGVSNNTIIYNILRWSGESSIPPITFLLSFDSSNYRVSTVTEYTNENDSIVKLSDVFYSYDSKNRLIKLKKILTPENTDFWDTKTTDLTYEQSNIPTAVNTTYHLNNNLYHMEKYEYITENGKLKEIKEFHDDGYPWEYWGSMIYTYKNNKVFKILKTDAFSKSSDSSIFQSFTYDNTKLVDFENYEKTPNTGKKFKFTYEDGKLSTVEKYRKYRNGNGIMYSQDSIIYVNEQEINVINRRLTRYSFPDGKIVIKMESISKS